MKVTRSLPCASYLPGMPEFHNFTGVDVGPLFVHKGRPDAYMNFRRGDWTITHTPTGHSIQKRVGSKARAIAMAKKLAALDCWGFDKPEQALSLAPDMRAAINAIREMP